MPQEGDSVNTNLQPDCVTPSRRIWSDAAMPWTELVLTAAALLATVNLFAVLVVARAHQS